MHKTEHSNERHVETRQNVGKVSITVGEREKKVMQKEERHYMRGIKTDKRQ